MSDFRHMAGNPNHRRLFEKLLYLACKRGDADLAAGSLKTRRAARPRSCQYCCNPGERSRAMRWTRLLTTHLVLK